MSERVTIQDVERTSAFSELFNGITRMHLRRQDGYRVLFSQRREIARRFVGMLLDGGLVPEVMEPIVAAPVEHGGTDE